MKKENIFTGILCICAIIMTFYVIKNHNNLVVSEFKPEKYIADWKTIIRDSKSNTVYIFSEYECPYCKTLNDNISLIKDEIKEVKLVYKHLPLTTIHKNAMVAAIADECYMSQRKDVGFKSYIFTHQERIAQIDWMKEVESLGIQNLSEFKDCFSGQESKSIILNDMEEAKKLGITSVPSILVDGKLYEGALDAVTLKKILLSR